MKVSLYNIDRPVVNGFGDCNRKGKLLFEIIAESDTERSLFRGIENYESEIRVCIAEEGSQAYIYKADKS